MPIHGVVFLGPVLPFLFQKRRWRLGTANSLASHCWSVAGLGPKFRDYCDVIRM